MHSNTLSLKVADVEYVKDLYPRIREDDSAIERYRAALPKLPPITVARGRVLVDGFHRWQAHRRENADTILAVDLGNLTDAEILREAITRNAAHGQQLSAQDKKRNAELFWTRLAHFDIPERVREIAELLSVSERTVQGWTKDARAEEKRQQQGKAWDLWLDCQGEREIADVIGVSREAINDWVGSFRKNADFTTPPASLQHFDVWSFQKAADDAGQGSYFGRMPAQVVENLLWFYTETGQIVFDPFAGGGTTIDVAKRMGRRVWASDLNPSTPNLPIHKHDITTGWPEGAPAKVDFVLLDPPYWKQAAGRYSELPEDLGNMDIDAFRVAWANTVANCIDHLRDGGFLAYIISPSVDGERVVDHALDMYLTCVSLKLQQHRRIIVPYQTQQATGQQVTWARENRQMLKLYRDVVVLRK